MTSTRVTPNSQTIPLDIVGGSSFGRYSKINASKTFNMFISSSGPSGIEGQEERWLVNFPGYRRVLNLLEYPDPYPTTPPLYPDQVPVGEGRGIFHSTRGDFIIVVVNSIVFSLSPTLGKTEIGTLGTSTGEVFIAENLSSQICIVDGIHAYIYDYAAPAPNLTVQTNGALGTGALVPNYAEYHNTYFLFGNANISPGQGSAWYIYATGLSSSLGAISIIGTGVLSPTELIINGIDLTRGDAYASVADFVDYINTGVVFGVTATSVGSAVTLISPNVITLQTAGTVIGNGISFANFDTTAGANTETFGTPDSTLIIQVQQQALQTKADFALAVKRIPGRGNNVLVFGKTVCEIWTQVGGVQVYQRNPTININYGCQSVSTIAEGGDMLVWLGINEDESPAIMTYDGTTPKNISTDGIEYLMGTIKHPDISTAILARDDGHLFYMLTFYHEDDNLTLMYDFETNLFFNLTNQNLDYHPARGMVYFNLTTYFISLRNAALYELSSDITVIDENLPREDASSPYNPNLVYEMQFMRITSNIRQANSGRFVANSLGITLEQGTDINYTGISNVDYLITESIFTNPDDEIITEQGQQMVSQASSNSSSIPYVPRIDLALSKDGGITWSNYVSRTLHPLGHRQNILHWEGMGVANDLCFKFRFWQTNRVIVQNGGVDIIV